MTRRKSYQKGNVQLHNGQWTLRYRELDHSTGKWATKRVKLGSWRSKKKVREAADLLMKEINERNNSTEVPKSHADIRFKEFIDGRWKAYTTSAKHQPSTRDCYGSLIRIHLLPYFGQRRLRSITPADISRFLERLQPKVSANTLQSFYGLLRLMFDLAYQYDLIDSNPVRPRLHRPESVKVEKPTLSAEEIRKLLEVMTDEQERLFTLIVAVTGMRLGETLALRWTDFDAVKCELQINHTLYRGELKQPKTESSRRPLRLVPSVAELLVSHRERSKFQAATDFIFCRADGSPLSPPRMREHLHRAMDTAGIKRVSGKHGFHIFRHTAGSLIYMKSRDLKLVQSTLGHANISITSDVYVHLDDRTLSEGTEILAKEILGNCDLTVTKKGRKAS